MPDLNVALWYAVTVAGLFEAARKMLVNRRIACTPGRNCLCLGLVLIAVSFAAGARPTMVWVDRVMGVPHLAFLLQGALAMAAMACVAGFLRALDWLRLRLCLVTCLAGSCLGVMVALFVMFGPADPAFGAASDSSLASRGYSLIYLTYMAVWLALFIRGLWGIGVHEERAIRAAVALACLGLSVLLVAMTWRLFAHVRGLIVPGSVAPGMRMAAAGDAIGSLLFVASSAFASVVRAIRDRADHARIAGERAAIARLWRTLAPVRGAGSAGDVRRVPDVRQQVIDIFDARLILRRFVGARLVTESAVARGLQFEDRWTDQLASAVELVLGLRLYRETHGLCDQPLAGTADHDAWPEDAAVTVDDDPRIGWLAEVARLAESSSVSEIASMLEASSVDQRCPPASV